MGGGRSKPPRLFHVKHGSSLTDAEVAKDDVQQILDIHPAGQPPKSIGRMAQFLGAKFERQVLAERRKERAAAALERVAVPRLSDQRRFAGLHAVARERAQRQEERIDPLARLGGDQHVNGRREARPFRGRIDQVDLGPYPDRRPGLPRGEAGRRGDIGHGNHEIRRLRPRLRPPDTLPFHAALGLAKPRGIDDRKRIAGDVEPHLDQVPGGPRLVGDDRHVAPGKGVDEAGLAGIDGPDHHHLGAVAQPLAAPAIVEMPGDVRRNGLHVVPGTGRYLFRHIVLVGEVQFRFHHGARPDQPRSPRIERPAQRPGGLAHRLAPLRLGLGMDQIGEPLDLGEVEPTGCKGAARELAGVGGPQAHEARQSRDHRRNHGTPAMHMKLGDVLPGEARRPGKEENETRIDHRAVLCPQGSERRPAWFRNRSDNRFEDVADLGAAHAQHRHPRRRSSARERENCRLFPCRHAPRFPYIGPMSENLLRHEASPYLLQHQDNPVHWRPWGPAALAEARGENKPILLSVGYAACHWCHVMAHESFEDPATAAVMNRLFVNIKVDREERPDIDQIYMGALHALGEQGGWPLTMFLTPDGEPIWGGTYFPPEARYGRPAFTSVLEEVARIFREEPAKIETNRSLLMQALGERRAPSGTTPDRDLLDRAAERLLGFIDTQHGGVRGAPKFPQASLLDMLWRTGQRTGDSRYRDAVLVTLRNIAQGGIYDHLGGGFARYSVDDRWLVPHFEKMLYDNAQLLELLTLAALETGDPLFRLRIEETIAFLVREMRLPGGAFAASLDADSEGHEGKFYVWSAAEVVDVLGPDEAAFFASVYDITPAGNFEGTSIPNRLAHQALLSEAEESRLTAARERLLARRAERIRPATDDKVLADWNGLAIAALAFAGATFGRADWVTLARDAHAFIHATMSRDGRLAHAWRDGKSVYPGLATDYAAMIKASLALHAATLETSYLAAAESLAVMLRRHHWDDDAPGYFLPADDAEALILRPRSTTDEATPSANSVMAANLVRLWRLTGKDAWRADADAIIAAAPIAENLFAASGMLSALDLRLGATDVVLVLPPETAGAPLLDAVRAAWTPNTVLAVVAATEQLPAAHPAAGKPAIDGLPTAYVCRGETCSLPVTEPGALAGLLRPAANGPGKGHQV